MFLRSTYLKVLYFFFTTFCLSKRCEMKRFLTRLSLKICIKKKLKNLLRTYICRFLKKVYDRFEVQKCQFSKLVAHMWNPLFYIFKCPQKSVPTLKSIFFIIGTSILRNFFNFFAFKSGSGSKTKRANRFSEKNPSKNVVWICGKIFLAKLYTYRNFVGASNLLWGLGQLNSYLVEST